MRLMVTADLHFNHTRSRRLAEELIEQMNVVAADVLLLVGDAAVGDGGELEECLSRFRFAGPKLFVAGNHELWTREADSYLLHRQILPQRVRDAGWHWLEGNPFWFARIAIVGSLGWYDYSFASTALGIPKRFYEAKMSPGAAKHFGRIDLLERSDDIAEGAMELYARWNDGQFVKLGRPDEVFLDEELSQLRADLDSVKDASEVVAAVHHVPFEELLPPLRRPQWDFARAYLGSGKIGQILSERANVQTVICGHSHYPIEARIGHVRGINIGSGYRAKRYEVIDLT